MQPEALAWAIEQAEGTRWRVLADAYTSGELRVRFADGREVTYRTTAEIGSVLLAGYSAAGVTATARRPAMTVARVGNGFS